MSYVRSIEPRLTPPRPVRPATAADALAELCRDLRVELDARLAAVGPDELVWRPHPDANHVAVTAWHVARWLDVLAARAFTGAPVAAETWHSAGWAARTAYDPTGLGHLGLGTLTGYTPAQMRAVPVLPADDLRSYLAVSADALVDRIGALGPALTAGPHPERAPYAAISTTLEGSFGHLGEIDALVSLRELLVGPAERRPDRP